MRHMTISLGVLKSQQKALHVGDCRLLRGLITPSTSFSFCLLVRESEELLNQQLPASRVVGYKLTGKTK